MQVQKLFASYSQLLKFHFYKNKNQESFISLFLFFIPKMYFYFIYLFITKLGNRMETDINLKIASFFLDKWNISVFH